MMGVRTGVAWVAAAADVAAAAACCALAARSSAHFVDIQVYRMGGAAVLHGEDLYRLRLGTLPFTYPPFAAVVLTALAAPPSGDSAPGPAPAEARRAWSAGPRIGSGGGAGRRGGGYLAGSHQGRARL